MHDPSAMHGFIQPSVPGKKQWEKMGKMMFFLLQNRPFRSKMKILLLLFSYVDDINDLASISRPDAMRDQ